MTDRVDPQQGAPGAPLPWADFNAETFARAKREGRFVVLDGAAEWCHWCHVMEATTYHDPAVRKILDERFVAAKIDVDSRPDLEERYGDYGWPATVIFSPDGQELGKYRGYLPPDRFVEILRAVVESPTRVAKAAAYDNGSFAEKGPLSEDQLAWIARFADVELAEYYDDDEGGWGRTQKAAMAMDDAWALDRASHGDALMKTRVLFTLDHEIKLVDPVWGGLYQYSAARDWDHPHFEKLMTFQAGALESFAEAYALTKDPKWLGVATKMRAYVDQFLLGPDGGFYTTQDADVNAHQPGKRFVNGHDYYALPDAKRRALGIPRVDTSEYARENGLAIAAYVSFFEATGERSALATAERAAVHVIETHATTRGGVAHESKPEARVLHLGDNAAFGYALLRLYDATKNRTYLERATAIGQFLLKDLQDEKGGGFYASTLDPDAVGVFQERRKPFDQNVTALRFLAKLVRAKAGDSTVYTRAIAGTLRAIATPDAIKDRGRMIGDFLLALEETKGVR